MYVTSFLTHIRSITFHSEYLYIQQFLVFPHKQQHITRNKNNFIHTWVFAGLCIYNIDLEEAQAWVYWYKLSLIKWMLYIGRLIGFWNGKAKWTIEYFIIVFAISSIFHLMMLLKILWHECNPFFFWIGHKLCILCTNKKHTKGCMK